MGVWKRYTEAAELEHFNRGTPVFVASGVYQTEDQDMIQVRDGGLCVGALKRKNPSHSKWRHGATSTLRVCYTGTCCWGTHSV